MRFNRFLEAHLNDAIHGFSESNFKADIFLNQFLRSKKIGKRDRLWVSDRFYYYLRHKLFFDKISSDNTLSKNIAMMFENEPDDKLVEKITELKNINDFENLYNKSFSSFLQKRIGECYNENAFEWFNTKSKIVIRTNLHKIQRDILLQKLKDNGFEVEMTPVSPAGIKILNSSSNLKNSELFKEGYFEFQDESSQLASFLVNRNFKKMLDCCAGGGGKSLAVRSFFADMEITASDIRSHLFKEIEERSARAGAKIRTAGYGLVQDLFFDTVFVDAPCSGSGVLRRNPADRYEITKRSVEEIAGLQSELISKFSKNVSVGGELIYVTCSFLKEENEDIVERFLNENNDFQLVSADERFNVNGLNVESEMKITHNGYLRTEPLFERDLMFGAVLKKIR
ncbi:MAG TPA: RsmB/NOP family class I SAM-dependent RNA methyltransferase [bacterium]|nr:RsmB/NOP family class I SAM-dependent RNA methyltransferase [bacterium]